MGPARYIDLVRGLLIWGLVVALPDSVLGQETSPEIELGSSRIGGPGLTPSERRWVSRFEQSNEFLTEENIPKKGSKKRLGALHTLAEHSLGSKEWAQACSKFDTIREEYGIDGVNAHPRGAQNAHRAYYQCARTAANSNEDKAERLLVLSESFGNTTAKHERVREKILRSRYRTKLLDGDYDGAITLFQKAQAMRADEDERIWLGQELAERAWQAYHTQDRVTLDHLVSRTDEIAPMNTDFRRLKEKLNEEDSILRNVGAFILGIVGFLLVWTGFNRWRNRRLVERALGSREGL